MNLVTVSLENLFQALAKYNKHFHVDITAMLCTNKMAGMRHESSFVFYESLILSESWLLETTAIST